MLNPFAVHCLDDYKYCMYVRTQFYILLSLFPLRSMKSWTGLRLVEQQEGYEPTALQGR